jgi:glycosyltransferase involved in cell wall biosynthesis
MPESKQDPLIISKKWGAGRGKHTSVERFCEILDPHFPEYHGQRVHIHPGISRTLKQWTNSKKSADYTAPYNSNSFELELWGLKQAFKKKYRYAFFPYADYDYYYWQYFKKLLGMKVILWSFFSEKELQERFKNLSHFEKVDLVLVAGRSQLSYIREHTKNIHAQYFPIGVDTGFFKPEETYDPFRIVHVGNNRRDFETLIKGIDLVYHEFPQIKLDLIGASSSRDIILDRPYIRIYDHIEDVDYLKILQNSNFAVLSLDDGGSSNSLLELCSCGLPVVVTDLPNIRDYLANDFAIRINKQDPKDMAEQIRKLLHDQVLRHSMSEKARAHAIQYDWETLVEKFHHLIDKI